MLIMVQLQNKIFSVLYECNSEFFKLPRYSRYSFNRAQRAARMEAANRARLGRRVIDPRLEPPERGRRNIFVGPLTYRRGSYVSHDSLRALRARVRSARMLRADVDENLAALPVEQENADVDAIIDVDADEDIEEGRPSFSNSASTSAGAGTTRNIRILDPVHAEDSENADVVPQAITVDAASENAMLNTPSPPKKRKRVGSGTPKSKSTPKLDSADANSEDDSNSVDDGCTCSICFDHWEMSGEHRLVALRCGHLFGESCIRRWLTECGRQSGVKMCPQCKTKATPRDIRCLYAKRVRAIDRTEEHELRKSLELERKKLKNVEGELDTLKINYAVTLRKVQEQDLEIERLKSSYRLASNAVKAEETESTLPSKTYKLFMEKNIVLSRDSGCRVMAYSDIHSSLLVSQKNSNNMFPGFGVRIIDVPSFRATQFIYLTSNMLRDISISADQQIMACTSMEPSAKLYDFRSRSTVSIAAPNSDKKLWACAMGDATREQFLYAGGQQGTTFVFDTRQTSNVIAEYETMGDLSPVVSIVVIPNCDEFPLGGFCICKLQSVWFYEYQTSGIALTRLNVEGPFMSMNYEKSQSLLIITARVNTDTESRYLVGKLQKVHSRPHFELKATLLGSKTTPVMTRSCHISIDSNSLLASYIQDAKQLAVFDINRKQRIQSLPIQDVVFDACPIYTPTDVYVAALTESKCRIYKLIES